MSRTVFVLGAGASAAAGAPVMRTFMSAATEILRGGRLEQEDKAAFELVLRARTKLQAVHSKAELDLNNIETLFGAYEMGSLLGKLGDLTATEVEHLPSAMVRVICTTLQQRLRFPASGSGEQRRVRPPQPYEAFIDLVTDYRQKERVSDAVSIITFNYDPALDYAVHFAGLKSNYCLDPNDTAGIPVMKLHGSVSWGICAKCNTVIPFDMKDYFSRYHWPFWSESQFMCLDFTGKLCGLACCNMQLQNTPVVAPPTWNKGRFHSQLASVWKSAARHLSDAEHIFFIGYSLPNTDEFFRYFYALGSVGDSIFSTVWVVNPDPSVESSYRRVLGSHALSSGCFRMVDRPFESSIPVIKQRLGLL